jgi:tetratricopeptide (TPR) repeat protein
MRPARPHRNLLSNAESNAVSDSFHQAPLLVDFFEAYLDEQDINTFLRAVSERYFIGTLERLALNGERMARRGSVLALGRLSDYQSNAVLGKALVDLDRGVRTLAENAISLIWPRVGLSIHQRRLGAVDEQLDEGDYDRASQLASKIIQDAPWIAQSWFQRGKAYYHLGQCDAATRDCHQALEINPYHFQAAAVMGQAYEKQHNLVAALESYRRALRLNPNMEEVRARVIQLQRALKNQ